MNTKQRTCAERITEHMNARLATFDAYAELLTYDDDDLADLPASVIAPLLDAAGVDTTDGVTWENIDEQKHQMFLSLEKAHYHSDDLEAFCDGDDEECATHVRLIMSTGGPHDEIRWPVDNPAAARYHFHDWFDGAHRAATGSLLELAHYYNDLL